MVDVAASASRSRQDDQLHQCSQMLRHHRMAMAQSEKHQVQTVQQRGQQQEQRAQQQRARTWSYREAEVPNARTTVVELRIVCNGASVIPMNLSRCTHRLMRMPLCFPEDTAGLCMWLAAPAPPICLQERSPRLTRMPIDLPKQTRIWEQTARLSMSLAAPI